MMLDQKQASLPRRYKTQVSTIFKSFIQKNQKIAKVSIIPRR